MSDALRKVIPGERLEIAASTWNSILDAVRYTKAQRVFDTEPVPTHRDLTIIKVRNDTGADVPRYGVLGLDDPLILPSDNESEFQRIVACSGVLPMTGMHEGKFAIALEPIAPDKIGNAAISGVVPVKLAVLPGDPKPFADIQSGSTAALANADIGSARVLWIESGIETERWCRVRLGDGANGAGTSLTVKDTAGATIISNVTTLEVEGTNSVSSPTINIARLHAASATASGIVSTTAQTFAGDKTVLSNVIAHQVSPALSTRLQARFTVANFDSLGGISAENESAQQVFLGFDPASTAIVLFAGSEEPPRYAVRYGTSPATSYGISGTYSRLIIAGGIVVGTQSTLTTPGGNAVSPGVEFLDDEGEPTGTGAHLTTGGGYGVSVGGTTVSELTTGGLTVNGTTGHQFQVGGLPVFGLTATGGQFLAGDSTNPGLGFLGNLNTGFFSYGPGAIGFTAAGQLVTTIGPSGFALFIGGQITTIIGPKSITLTGGGKGVNIRPGGILVMGDSGEQITMDANTALDHITIVADADNQVLANNKTRAWRCPFAFSILKWTVLGEPTGNVEWQIKSGTFADYPGGLATIVGAGSEPKLTAQLKNEGTVAGWKSVFPAGRMFEFKIVNPDVATTSSLILHIRKGDFAADLIPGLRLWLKANTLLLNDDDPVATWEDSSVVTGPAVQAVVALKPTFKANLAKDQPVVRFDGSDAMSVAGLALGAFTIFSVFRASAHGMIYEHSPDSNVNDGCFLYTDGGTVSTVYVNRGGQSSAKGIVGGVNWATDNVYRLVRHEWNGTHASHRLFANGVEFNMATIGGNNFDAGIAIATNTLFLGSRNQALHLLTGDLAELLIYDGILSATDAALIENYLNGKYGVF